MQQYGWEQDGSTYQPATGSDLVGEFGDAVQDEVHGWHNVLVVNQIRLLIMPQCAQSSAACSNGPDFDEHDNNDVGSHLVPRRSQRHVHHSAVLSGVDLLSSSHVRLYICPHSSAFAHSFITPTKQPRMPPPTNLLLLQARRIREVEQQLLHGHTKPSITYPHTANTASSRPHHRVVGDSLPGVVEGDAVVLGGESGASVCVGEQVPQVQALDLAHVVAQPLPRRRLVDACLQRITSTNAVQRLRAEEGAICEAEKRE